MEKRTEPFTGVDCCRTMYQPVPNGGFDNEGLVAILKLDILKPEFQKPEYQLFRLSSGLVVVRAQGETLVSENTALTANIPVKNALIL